MSVQGKLRVSRKRKPDHPALRGAPADLPFPFDAVHDYPRTELRSTDLSDNVRNVAGVEAHVFVPRWMSKTAAGRPRDLYVLPGRKALEEVRKKRLVPNKAEAARESPRHVS